MLEGIHQGVLSFYMKEVDQSGGIEEFDFQPST